MASESLLIIDDNAHTLSLLKGIFEKEGYTVVTARSGVEALKRMEGHTPNLILLDIVLPEMDGYAFLERVKAKPEWAFIPVVILTGKRGQEDKLRGLRLGVMDYLTKPFQREELVTRVRNIVQNFSRRFQTPLEASNGTDKGSRLLEMMRDRHLKVFVPSLNRTAKLGYVYAEAAEVIKPKELGAEVEVLESLAKQKKLQRVFFDTIHLCPRCGFHDLNFREVCPECGSPNIKTGRFFKHLPCGYRGWEEEFWKGNALACPRCPPGTDGETKDFEKSPVVFRCMVCAQVFEDPFVNCRCLQCGRLLDVNEVIRRNIYSYRLPPPPAKDNPVKATEPQTKTTLLETAVHEAKLETVEGRFFEKQLDLELKRAQRKEGNLTLLQMAFVNLDALRKKIGDAACQRALQSALTIVNKCLRELDVVGLKSDHELMVLLPDTPVSMARLLSERMKNYFDRLNSELQIQISLASFPENGKNPEDLLQHVERELRKSASTMVV